MKENNFKSILLVLLSLVIGIGVGYFIFNSSENKLSTNTSSETKSNNSVVDNNTDNQDNTKEEDDFYKLLGNVDYKYYTKEEIIKKEKYYEELEYNYYQYAILDIDGDNVDDIMVYEPTGNVQYDIVIYKGSDKGFYNIGRPIKGAHYSNSSTFRFKGKNYLTYSYAHMGNQLIQNIKLHDNGYEISNVLSNEISQGEKYYIDSIDKNEIEDINWIKM